MTTKLLAPVVNKYFDDLRRRVEKAKHVPCPACGMEWTKLYMCPYFWFDEKNFRRDDITYLCIECAQTPKGFDFIVATWPLAAPMGLWVKVDSFWPDNMIRYDEVDSLRTNDRGETVACKAKIFRWGELKVRVRAWNNNNRSAAPDFDCYLKAGSENISCWDAVTKSRVTYLNTVAAWFSIKARIPQAFFAKLDGFDAPPLRDRRGGFGKMR